jgi:hypothetical protein
VASIRDLEVVISYFDRYILITQKKADYLLFKDAFYLVKSKKHLTLEGLYIIVAIKASLNKGLSDNLKAAFPDVLSVPRLLVLNKKIQDPNWLSGFASAEGCFMIKNQEKKNYIWSENVYFSSFSNKSTFS